MAHRLFRVLTLTAIGLSAAVLSVAGCVHTTDRVVAPVSVGDASAPSPELDDAGLNPLTPIAIPPEQRALEDYRLVRAPELGQSQAWSQAHFVLTGAKQAASRAAD
jgi:hypothetical protein